MSSEASAKTIIDRKVKVISVKTTDAAVNKRSSTW